MRFIGLTGGIGSGKSTVARMLAERGAVILDSDVLAHEVVEPGTPGFEDVVARFGPEIVTPEGGVDRPALARVVFADDEARKDLEAIIHPLVRRRVAEEVAARVGTNDVVVLDSPLLIETGTYRDCQQVLVVSALPETQIAPARGARDGRGGRPGPAGGPDAAGGQGGVRRRGVRQRGHARRTRGIRSTGSGGRCAMTFRAVLFDVGETLVHPAPSFPALFSRCSSARGTPATRPMCWRRRGRARTFSEASRERGPGP